MVGMLGEQSSHLVGLREEEPIPKAHQPILRTLVLRAERCLWLFPPAPGLLLCFSALIHNGLAHSFVPFPPGYVTQVNKASLQGPCRNQIMLWVLQIRGLEKAFYLGIITIHSLFDDLFQDN